MPASIVVGCQFGDEGKGKIVDFLAARADMVVRSAGGNNAGHTVVKNGTEYKLHLIPSGILYPNVKCMLGNGVVIDLEEMIKEIDKLKWLGISMDNLRISSQAHVILPTHRYLDKKSEVLRGKNKIGTTGRGIGPTYKDKVGRCGVRLGDADLFRDELREVVSVHFNEHQKGLDYDHNVDDLVTLVKNSWNKLSPYVSHNMSAEINQALDRGDFVLFEGAQAVLLDIDHGTYPYVTSSSPCAAGACVGAGVGPTRINSVIGVAKAYTTRVGEGPFPTELFDDVGEEIRENGKEYGTTTGRPRRCGWLDLVILKYAAHVNGLNWLALTKLDVLNTLDEIKVCTGYKLPDGTVTDIFPTNSRILAKVEPQYVTFSGWGNRNLEVDSVEDLPYEAEDYIRFIESVVGVKVLLVGVGADRKSIVKNPRSLNVTEDVWGHGKYE